MKRQRAWPRGAALALCAAALCACAPAGALASEGQSAGTAVTVWQAPRSAEAAGALPRTGDGTPLAPIVAFGVCAAACAAGVAVLRTVPKGGCNGGGS